MGTHVEVVVDSRIRLDAADIGVEVAARLRKSCEHDNPEFAKKRAMNLPTYDEPPVIRTWRAEGKTLTLPRGAMSRVREALAAAGRTWKVVDRRTEGGVVSRPLRYVGDELRYYQEAAVAEALRCEQGVVRAPTGSGKTLTSLALAARVGLNTLIVLPNAKLLKQWVGMVERALGIRGDQIGLIRGSKRRLRTITVATQQTLWARGVDEEIDSFFGCVIGDEIHHAAARTFAETFDSFSARFRIGFSADERRRDRKEFLVYDGFSKVVHETSRKECEEANAVVDVEIRLVPTKFSAPWYARDKDWKRLLDEMTTDEDRNRIVLGLARGALAGGEQVIVLSHRIEHVRLLDRGLVASGVRSGCMLGGQDAGDEKEFEATREGLRDGSVRAGVGTYGALGEGIDLPAVAVGVAATPVLKNKQLLNQVAGRLCRPDEGKTHGVLYVPFDVYVFEQKDVRNIASWHRTVKILQGGRWVAARDWLAARASQARLGFG